MPLRLCQEDGIPDNSSELLTRQGAPASLTNFAEADEHILARR
ncbi:hypothetical protein [Bradyrhizobium sp. UFLA03-84]|nr:hypothetical protein [Bradyrhizobium sp. UFLA03-84]